MSKVKIKKGDTVRVIAGNDRGSTGKVLAVYPKKSQLLVQGCRLVKKAVKPSEKNPKGGFISKEMPIHISNVAKAEQ